MADVVATSAPAAAGGANPKSKSKDNKEKPPKPDEEAFKKNLAAAQAEHQKVREQLVGFSFFHSFLPPIQPNNTPYHSIPLSADPHVSIKPYFKQKKQQKRRRRRR
jgi:hypothetical protein